MFHIPKSLGFIPKPLILGFKIIFKKQKVFLRILSLYLSITMQQSFIFLVKIEYFHTFMFSNICRGKFSAWKKSASSSRTHGKETFGTATERIPSSPSKHALFLKSFCHYIENHRQQIVYLFLFVSICIMLFTERFYSKNCFLSMIAHSFLLNLNLLSAKQGFSVTHKHKVIAQC